MIYIHALQLIDLCVKHEILTEQDDRIFVYRDASEDHDEGWWLDEKDAIAKELMNDETGQNMLISELKKKKVEFVPFDTSGISELLSTLTVS